MDFAKFLNVVLLDNGLSWEHHISPLLLSLIVPNPILISTLLYDFITHVLTTNLFIVLLSGVAATISCYDSFVSRSVLGIYQPFIPATSSGASISLFSLELHPGLFVVVVNILSKNYLSLHTK